MANPFVHALVFTAAVLIPGGLLVYFAWRAISLKGDPNQNTKNSDSEYIPETQPSPEEAREAFRDMFPPESLRARNRKSKLKRAREFRHRKYKK